MNTWHKGTTDSSTNIQDELAIISSILGYKIDDHSNKMKGATELTTINNLSLGIISNANDIDYFTFSLAKEKDVQIIARPFSIGPNNLSANLDLIVKIYNAKGKVLFTLNNPGILSEKLGVSLSAGKYFISVQTTSNFFGNNYGMVGEYLVLVD